MLQIHHLKKSYNKKTEVLSDIDYTFEEGRVYRFRQDNIV